MTRASTGRMPAPLNSPQHENGERVLTRRFVAVVTITIFIVFTLSVLGLWRTATTVRLDTTVVPFSAAIIMLLAGWAYCSRDRRISETCFVMFWTVTVTNILNLPMFVVARLKLPFQDSQLVAFDRWLGFELPQVLALQQSYPATFMLVASCYNLLLPLLVVSITLPTFLGCGRGVREFFIALFVSGTIGLILFYLFPAEGVHERYGVPPSASQALFLETLYAVRREQSYALDISFRAGLVYFPSFHAILAILSVFALRQIPLLLALAAPVGALVVLSTVLTANHYPCDTLAGAVVAVLSCLVAKKLEPLVSGSGSCSKRE